jgi:hypothetical protein
MSKRRFVRPFMCVSALTIASALAISPVFAAGFPIGTYQAKGLLLAFDEKGGFHVEQAGTTEVSGSYSVRGGQIELTDVKGPWACTTAGQQKGTYNWKLDNTVITFSKVADSCDDRSGTLVSASWKLQR